MTQETASLVSWSLYVVRTVDNCLYAGITTDVGRRYGEHCARGARAARFLKSHPPRALVFSQRIGSHSLALKVEYRFKRLPKVAKERIITRGSLFFNHDSGEINE